MRIKITYYTKNLTSTSFLRKLLEDVLYYNMRLNQEKDMGSREHEIQHRKELNRIPHLVVEESSENNRYASGLESN